MALCWPFRYVAVKVCIIIINHCDLMRQTCYTHQLLQKDSNLKTSHAWLGGWRADFVNVYLICAKASFWMTRLGTKNGSAVQQFSTEMDRRSPNHRQKAGWVFVETRWQCKNGIVMFFLFSFAHLWIIYHNIPYISIYIIHIYVKSCLRVATTMLRFAVTFHSITWPGASSKQCCHMFDMSLSRIRHMMPTYRTFTVCDTYWHTHMHIYSIYTLF